MIYLWLSLILICTAWREWQILVDRGSWKLKGTWLPFWYFDQNSEEKLFGFILKKNLDSFHVSNGLRRWFTFEIFIDLLPVYTFTPEWVFIQLNIAVYWTVWMQLRNLLLHKIFKKGE
jgi:hypothetical protein